MFEGESRLIEVERGLRLLRYELGGLTARQFGIESGFGTDLARRLDFGGGDGCIGSLLVTVVDDETGAPIVGAMVEITTTAGPVIASGTTDGSGQVYFPLLPGRLVAATASGVTDYDARGVTLDLECTGKTATIRLLPTGGFCGMCGGRRLPGKLYVVDPFWGEAPVYYRPAGTFAGFWTGCNAATGNGSNDNCVASFTDPISSFVLYRYNCATGLQIQVPRCVDGAGFHRWKVVACDPAVGFGGASDNLIQNTPDVGGTCSPFDEVYTVSRPGVAGAEIGPYPWFIAHVSAQWEVHE